MNEERLPRTALHGTQRKIDLLPRTKRFALRTIAFVESLPRGLTTDVIGKQMIRCGTSVGANYRSAHRARSKADFIAKMGIVVEEADECLYWMGLLAESGLVAESVLAPMMAEADELLAIMVASVKTAQGR